MIDKRQIEEKTKFETITSDKEIDDIFNKLNDKYKVKEEKQKQIKPQLIDEVAEKWQMNTKFVEIFEEKSKKETKLKEIYAFILIVMLGIQLFFVNCIFLAVGAENLKYSDVSFDIYIAGSLIEIFGLVTIVVKYLFKDNLTGLLQTILRNTNGINRGSKKNHKIQNEEQ